VTPEPSSQCPEPSIPGYQLLRRIGAGSYGDVWLVRNEAGQLRALKVIFRSKLGSSPADFQREYGELLKYGMVADLYPGLMQIHHFGQNTTKGHFYYVTELADDVTKQRPSDPDCNSYRPRTLDQVLGADRQRVRLPLAEWTRIGIELTQALGQLHEGGLVYRNIRPSNIVFVRNLATFSVFGLVAIAEEGGPFAGPQPFTPLEGPGTKLADIFSLGRVLYEMAMGLRALEYPRLPEDMEDLDVAVRKNLKNICEILIKACHPNTGCRYTSAAELGKELQLLAGAAGVEDPK